MKNFTKTTRFLCYLFFDLKLVLSTTSKFLTILVLLGSSFLSTENVIAQSCFRSDINDYTSVEKCELRNLIVNFLELNTSIILAHQEPLPPDSFESIHCYNEHFLSWHRDYVNLLETWLLTQETGEKYVPLPAWNPANPIPCEFFSNRCLSCPGNAVAECFDSTLHQTTLKYDFDKFLNPSNLCSYTSGERTTPQWNKTRVGSAIDNFAFDLQIEHDYVNTAIGGVMNTELAPAAAIFWLFHAFLDDIYKKYECQCGNRKQTDLYIRDVLGDKGEEPGEASNFYHSPDIWIRNMPDMELEHQQPEFGVDNYIYVRVWNRGCSTVWAGDVNLEVYGSKGNAGGASWSTDWSVLPQGTFIGTQSLPTIEPGNYHIAKILWTPPSSWNTSSNVHACLLTRLVSNIDPMTYSEMSITRQNARKNNNIAWKNLNIACTDPYASISIPTSEYELEIIRPSHTNAPIKLEFSKKNNFTLNQIILSAESNIMANFLAQGTWQGMNLIGDPAMGNAYFVIVDNNASIYNLNLPAGQNSVPIKLQFNFRCDPSGGFPCAKYGDVYEYDVRQYAQEANKEELLGGNKYQLKIKQRTDTTCNSIITDAYVEHPFCENTPSGLISLQLAGRAPYTFYWCHGATTASVSGLLPGKYEVTVSDADNCVSTAYYDLIPKSDLEIEFETQAPQCNRWNGYIRSAVKGGKPPYTYKWSNAKQDTSIQDLAPGLYGLVITDSNGCQASNKVFLGNSIPLGGITYGTYANNGLAYIQPSGGYPPYTYLWSNGATTDTITNLEPGDYTVTLTDSLGCTFVSTITIPMVTELSIKVYLQGPFHTTNGLMNDDLRTNNILPNIDPYGFNQELEPNLLSVTGSDAIVDWVKVEIRDPNTPATILQSTAALLQRDGDVVYIDGISAVPFLGLANGIYHIAVKHRNHLAVMTSTPLYLD